MATLEDQKKALERKYVETRPPLAYAKISGRVHDDKPFEMLITHLPVELGRGALSSTFAACVVTHCATPSHALSLLLVRVY